jgi:Zn-finger protein
VNCWDKVFIPVYLSILVGNGDITTVKLDRKTKDRLDRLRVHTRETYDEILQRVLGILNICRDDPERAQARLRAIERQKKINARKD